MQVTQSQSNLHRKELYLLLRERLGLVLQVLKYHTALYEGHQKVYSELILENEIKVYQERVVHRAQNVLLPTQVVKLFVLNDQVLADAFHGEKLVLLLIVD